MYAATGPIAGKKVKLDIMVAEYLEEIGFDLKTTEPDPVLVAKLDLGRIVSAVHKRSEQ